MLYCSWCAGARGAGVSGEGREGGWWTPWDRMDRRDAGNHSASAGSKASGPGDWSAAGGCEPDQPIRSPLGYLGPVAAHALDMKTGVSLACPSLPLSRVQRLGHFTHLLARFGTREGLTQTSIDGVGFSASLPLGTAALRLVFEMKSATVPVCLCFEPGSASAFDHRLGTREAMKGTESLTVHT